MHKLMLDLYKIRSAIRALNDISGDLTLKVQNELISLLNVYNKLANTDYQNADDLLESSNL